MEKLSLRNAGRELPVALDRFACAGKSQCVGVKCVGVVEAAIKSCRKSTEQAKIPNCVDGFWVGQIPDLPSQLAIGTSFGQVWGHDRGGIYAATVQVFFPVWSARQACQVLHVPLPGTVNTRAFDIGH